MSTVAELLASLSDSAPAHSTNRALLRAMVQRSQLDAIPVVADNTARAATFPTPTGDERVFNKSTGDVERYDATSAAWGINTRVARPSAFAFNPGFDIIRTARGQFQPSVDFSSLKPALGTVYFVGWSGASDSNDGLTTATSLANVSTAVAKPGIKTIYLYPKNYTRTQGTISATPTTDTSLISVGGRANIGTYDTLTWSLNTGSTYQATRSAVSNVYDSKFPDANGDYQRLTSQTSIANVDANPGSYYSNGTTVYVRTSDSRNLVGDTLIRVYLSVKGVLVSGLVRVYLENIDFEGGTVWQFQNGSVSTIPTVIGKNCSVKYSTTDLASNLGAITYFQDCLFAQGNSDNLNYHALNGVAPQGVEWNCISRDYGWIGTGETQNASTAHDGGQVIRVGGTYGPGYGPTIADVLGAFSLNLGVRAKRSTALTSIQNSNFYSQGTMWLNEVISESSVYDLVANTNGLIYTHNIASNGNNSATTGGVISAY